MQHYMTSCTLCGENTKVLFEAFDENSGISKENFIYSKCYKCLGISLNNPPHNLKMYYQHDYYKIPEFKRLQKIANKDRTKINTLLNYAKPGHLLEIGPAFGVFALQAKQAGFEVDVIEMDENCCRFLHNTLGVNVTHSSEPHKVMQTLPTHDVIAIWHVLEHLPNILDFLRIVNENLKSGGVFIAATPNPNAWQFKVMGKHWPHLDAPRHLSLIPHSWLVEKGLEMGWEMLYVNTNDSDAKSWNRFGWQRLLMNRFESKFVQRLMFLLGFLISLMLIPMDQKNFNGSAYTIAFRKR